MRRNYGTLPTTTTHRVVRRQRVRSRDVESIEHIVAPGSRASKAKNCTKRTRLAHARAEYYTHTHPYTHSPKHTQTDKHAAHTASQTQGNRLQQATTTHLRFEHCTQPQKPWDSNSNILRHWRKLLPSPSRLANATATGNARREPRARPPHAPAEFALYE